MTSSDVKPYQPVKVSRSKETRVTLLLKSPYRGYTYRKGTCMINDLESDRIA